MLLERQAFPAVEDQLAALLSTAAAGAARCGLARELQIRIELVLEELFLNTVQYGMTGAPAGRVYLSLYPTASGVRLIYEDDGRAYDPFSAVDRAVLDERASDRRVGGLGILLVEGLAQYSRYQRIDERNRIELSFEPTPAAR